MIKCRNKCFGPLDKWVKSSPVFSCAVCTQEIKGEVLFRCMSRCGLKGSGQCCAECWGQVVDKERCIVCNQKFQEQDFVFDPILEEAMLWKSDKKLLQAYMSQATIGQIRALAKRVSTLYPQSMGFVCDVTWDLLIQGFSNDEDHGYYPVMPVFQEMQQSMADTVARQIIRLGTGVWMKTLVSIFQCDMDAFRFYVEWTELFKLHRVFDDFSARNKDTSFVQMVCNMDATVENFQFVMDAMQGFTHLHHDEFTSLVLDRVASVNWRISASFAEWLLSTLNERTLVMFDKAMHDALSKPMPACVANTIFKWYAANKKSLPECTLYHRKLAVALNLAEPTYTLWFNGQTLKAYYKRFSQGWHPYTPESWDDDSYRFCPEPPDEKHIIMIWSKEEPDITKLTKYPRFSLDDAYLYFRETSDGIELFKASLRGAVESQMTTLLKANDMSIMYTRIVDVYWDKDESRRKRKIQFI